MGRKQEEEERLVLVVFIALIYIVMKNYGVITRPPNTTDSNCEFLVPQSLLSFQGIYNIFILKTKKKQKNL